ncbi:MAG: mono/diheme cytochrome c family protein [Candidatus Latescibacterota bacterium]|jgi:mono/diheme cytochrome c family protein
MIPTLKKGHRFGLCLIICLLGCSDAIINSIPTEPSNDPAIAELGLRLIPHTIEMNLEGLSQTEIDQISLGSYLVNGAAGCTGCHNSPTGEHLAGGVEFPAFFLPPDIQGNTTLFSRNLTPDPDTGLKLTEAQFIEAMKTGKDFHDSEESGQDSRMVFMPSQVYRFMLEKDLKAIYAYLKRIPPVRNPLRLSYIPGFPFPPVPPPPLSDEGSDPNGVERGLSLINIFASGPGAETFATQFNTTVNSLSAAERAKVGRGSYLINTIADCSNCHTDGTPDGNYDGGLIPGTFDVNITGYLAGGVNLGPLLGAPFEIFTRNLTPHQETGLTLTEAQFIQVLRFGADFRRPNGSLRTNPHFPAEFRMTLDDFSALYAFLRAIPAVEKEVVITP